MLVRAGLEIPFKTVHLGKDPCLFPSLPQGEISLAHPDPNHPASDLILIPVPMNKECYYHHVHLEQLHEVIILDVLQLERALSFLSEVSEEERPEERRVHSEEVLRNFDSSQEYIIIPRDSSTFFTSIPFSYRKSDSLSMFT